MMYNLLWDVRMKRMLFPRFNKLIILVTIIMSISKLWIKDNKLRNLWDFLVHFVEKIQKFVLTSSSNSPPPPCCVKLRHHYFWTLSPLKCWRHNWIEHLQVLFLEFWDIHRAKIRDLRETGAEEYEILVLKNLVLFPDIWPRLALPVTSFRLVASSSPAQI
jgi:hypothetical protein